MSFKMSWVLCLFGTLLIIWQISAISPEYDPEYNAAYYAEYEGLSFLEYYDDEEVRIPSEEMFLRLGDSEDRATEVTSPTEITMPAEVTSPADVTSPVTLPIEVILPSESEITELTADTEHIKECDRNARASSLCEPDYFNYMPWYPDPYTWFLYNLGLLKLGYFRYNPMPLPVGGCFTSVGDGAVPFRDVVPVKGKVRIVSTFNDCSWNYPTPMTPVLSYDESYHGYDTAVPFYGTIPVSDKVTIAATFNDFDNINPAPFYPLASPGSNAVPFSDIIPVSGKVTIAAHFR